MSRHTWTDIDPDVVDGTALADDYLDPLVAALYTTHFGAGAPAEGYAGSGLLYLEDLTTEWVMRLRDATGSPIADVEVWRYDLVTQSFTFGGGSGVGPLLQAFIDAGSSANKLPYYSGTNVVALTDLSAFARTFLDDAAASNVRTTLGLVIGTDVQAYDAELAVLAGLVPVQGSFIVGGPATWQAMTGAQATAYLSAFVGDDGGSPNLGVKGLVPAPGSGDNVKFLKGDGSWGTPAGSGDVVGPASSVDSEVALFSGIGGKTLKRASITGLAKLTSGVLSAASSSSDYMAYDATLASIAALGTAADKLAYTTGVDTWAEAAITSFGRSLIDDAAASNARTTLGLVIGTDVQAFLGFTTGAVLKRTIGTYATNAGITAVIPSDDTIPQSGEGTEIISVSHTPLSATNILRCTFKGAASADAAGRTMAVALFKDAGADAIVATGTAEPTADYMAEMAFVHEFVAGGTSAITLAVRAGQNNGAGSMRFNGTTAARRFGGVMKAALLIEEIVP